MSGSGLLLLKNGSIYLGETDQGVRIGQGRSWNNRRGLYSGNWLSSKYHGEGKLVSLDGATYRG